MISKLGLLLVLGLTTGAAVILLAARNHPVHPYSGQEWLSWSASEREIYVRGYIDGNGLGTHQACLETEELFETNEEHHLGDATHPSDFPSARCLAKRPVYSKARSTPDGLTGLSAYTDVITEFYTKRPEYRGVQFDFLMMQLNDKDFKTADQLFEDAKSYRWDLQWPVDF